MGYVKPIKKKFEDIVNSVAKYSPEKKREAKKKSKKKKKEAAKIE